MVHIPAQGERIMHNARLVCCLSLNVPLLFSMYFISDVHHALLEIIVYEFLLSAVLIR